MGERPHRYVWYDDSGKQSGINFAETCGQRRPDEDNVPRRESITRAI